MCSLQLIYTHAYTCMSVHTLKRTTNVCLYNTNNTKQLKNNNNKSLYQTKKEKARANSKKKKQQSLYCTVLYSIEMSVEEKKNSCILLSLFSWVILQGVDNGSFYHSLFFFFYSLCVINVRNFKYFCYFFNVFRKTL